MSDGERAQHVHDTDACAQAHAHETNMERARGTKSEKPKMHARLAQAIEMYRQL